LATLTDLVVAVALSTPKTLSDFASPGARLFRGLNDDIAVDVLLAGNLLISFSCFMLSFGGGGLDSCSLLFLDILRGFSYK
jgi:hypothetical protein